MDSSLYGSGSEDLVVSSGLQQMVDLVRYYSKHPSERKQIVPKALKTVSQHSYRNREEQAIQFLLKEGIIRNTPFNLND